MGTLDIKYNCPLLEGFNYFFHWSLQSQVLIFLFTDMDTQSVTMINVSIFITMGDDRLAKREERNFKKKLLKGT